MDKNTYLEMMNAHKNRIYSYVLYCLRHRDDAEDVTQEVFMRLWKNGADLDPEKVEAWLIRVAHNLCVDHSRRKKTQTANFGRPDETAVEKLVDTSKSWANPEAGLHEEDGRLEILAAMDTLPTETRSIMLQHYFHGHRLNDIAERLGKKTSTVKVQVHRARKALRLVLEAGANLAPVAKRETG